MAWTDDPLIALQTLIRQIHVQELRDAIDTLNDVACAIHHSTNQTTYRATHRGVYDSSNQGNSAHYITYSPSTYSSVHNSEDVSYDSNIHSSN